ncbi:hypothetical protein H5410_064696 [Solanum commersonii]|uniref:Uncharacterized protein n=1 Tax=Solanum commersonii TaxID=4109 RepID=A0A9J5VYM4_SOLCO|nr:hypothetical protein H5410_064696 [Solanum commersonii]
MSSRGKKCVTGESRWAYMVEEDDEHVRPHSKLIPRAPTFVPKGSSVARVSSLLHPGQQLILTGCNVQQFYVSDKELIDALGSSNIEKWPGRSTFSPNQFANLQDEEGDEEDRLDQGFVNAARDTNISPRHLPMRLAEQNHMTVSINSSRSNNSKKKL